MTSIWVKKMIHRRKSPKTSYIERSGREGFECNTFEFPARFETKFRSNAGSSDAGEAGHKRARRNPRLLEKWPRKILDRRVAGGAKRNEPRVPNGRVLYM
jgi:hypothetical protein